MTTRVFAVLAMCGSITASEMQKEFTSGSKAAGLNGIYDAFAYLENKGIAIRFKGSDGIGMCALDRRHPVFPELRAFGKALFSRYVGTTAGAAALTNLSRGRHRLPRDPNGYEPDLDVFGDGEQLPNGKKNRKRIGAVLQLLAAIGECPLYVLAGSLGIALTSLTILVRRYRQYGILQSRGVNVHISPATHVHAVSLNPGYPAYEELLGLLRRVNSFAPEYAQMARSFWKKASPQLKDAMELRRPKVANKRRRRPK